MPPSGNALWRILRAIAEIRKAAMPLNPAPHDGVFRAQLFKLIAVHADEGVRWASGHTGRTGFTVVTQIALVGFGFSARTFSPAPLLRTTGRTTTSMAP